MKTNFDFKGLFIYDLANNHEGSIEHGLEIIKGIGEVSKRHGVRGVFKFQFRHIDTLIHPDYMDNKEIKHIPRFVATRLSDEKHQILTDEVRKNGMITCATPFDERSLELINKLEIEIIKVPSCSATDWPLLDAIRRQNKPVIVSTAGLSISDIDKIVSFLNDYDVEFAIMHCVAIYPTPFEKLNLNQISLLNRRYPDITIGYSTHEPPEYIEGIQTANALGARLFERHVDVIAEGFKKNLYSSSPDQVNTWLEAYKRSLTAVGHENRPPADRAEVTSLNSLKRGVYTTQKITKGSKLDRTNVFFAMPLHEGQLASGDFKEGLAVFKDYNQNEAISNTIIDIEPSDKEIVNQIMLQIKGMLNEARIHIGEDVRIEISSHYGLQRFREFGAVIINIINREYCKKLIIQLPRQKHPYHYHKIKEETFIILYGDVEIEIDGDRKHYVPGDMITVLPGEWHKFQTLNGTIFEEISTTHIKNDSVYEDPRIEKLDVNQRKIMIDNWVKK